MGSVEGEGEGGRRAKGQGEGGLWMERARVGGGKGQERGGVGSVKGDGEGGRKVLRDREKGVFGGRGGRREGELRNKERERG